MKSDPMRTNGGALWYLITLLASAVWIFAALWSGENQVIACLWGGWLSLPVWIDWIVEWHEGFDE